MDKNPIIIQNHINPIESFRTEFFQDGELKANRFIFNPFQTEKERIVLRFSKIGKIFIFK